MAEDVKVSRFVKARKDLIRFFKDVRSELRKVIWLNREQLINNTLTVLLACLVVGIVIWVFDAGLLQLSELVFTR